MTKERDLLARAGLVIAQYRIKDPENPALRKLSHQINAYFEENSQDEEPVAYIQMDQLEKASRSAMLCAVSSEPKQDQSIDLNASAAYLETLAPQWRKKNPDHVTDVLWGIRFAERHYGIRDEKK
jgi:hypothetical protein